jgi:hypothetical protein
MTGIEMTTKAKDDETWIVGVLVGGAVLAGATMIVVKLYELTERKGERATVRPTAHDWDTWRMPPLARLPAAHLSRLSRIWMIVLSHRCRRPRVASYLSACDGGSVIKATFANARRWGALRTLRLASRILRYATVLHRQRRISHDSLRTVLSGTRWLERCGAWLALGCRRKRQQIEQEFHRERID